MTSNESPTAEFPGVGCVSEVPGLQYEGFSAHACVKPRPGATVHPDLA